MPIPKNLPKSDYYDKTGHNTRQYREGQRYEHEAEEMAIRRLLHGKHFTHALDVGGYGRPSVLLQQFSDTVTRVEPGQKQPTLAADYLEGHHEIERQMMPGDHLELPDASVDLVVMIRVLHHLPHPDAELLEIARVLVPNGYGVIEVANYTHARNRRRHFIHHTKMPAARVDIGSHAGVSDNEIPFVNHNPKQMIRLLAHSGLKVERILSVSNLRSPGVKKLVPHRVLLAIEGILQPALGRSYFGPSVFFLVRKVQ